MKRTLYSDEHEEFRLSFRRFLEREIAPHREEWDRDHAVPHDAFRAAGAAGFLGMAVPEEHGGAGIDDFRFNAVQGEEIQRLGLMGFGMGLGLHNDLCLPYLLEFTTDEQKARWLPGVVSGDLLPSIAMTEPGTGSDLASIATTAIKGDDGAYRVDGAKTFISSGISTNLVILAVKTDPAERHRGLSLVVVEGDTPGFERGRQLEKIGLPAQDTAELFFSDARVPAENLLGEEGQGFRYLSRNLAQERMSIAIQAVGAAQAAIDWTVEYVRERKAFGKPIGALQNTRFVLAECRTETDVAQAFVDGCIAELVEGTLSAEDAAKAKYWCSEVQGRVVDRCLQLFGGYGYMTEYPIARAYQDARIARIYGGTTEIMKEIIGRSMRLEG
ncbi:acyl-CoA dehydrogenase family protein [Patulibacter sp.]|uniref:acyl-CoA dehydrogenase family protein n=1 Tax=Patulibacter sp. TaxID=1912859 RepID=UPI002716B206|nr:acyl-CoA dehydrogenase family protein [Patulibacter sp.]MDO9407923.1 acyl-CoA dehydrogenase family protein [Patulibacter sp.]